ncbi:ABC transporter permease [Specibacter sp. NPDC078692]|uniref:ABC transporter permease n=1 Tax=Specibacter sp. NPDC078692 TaxID=3155818 RepID=UPI003428FDD1
MSSASTPRAVAQVLPRSRATTGFWLCARFILRRNWLRLGIWAAVLALMIPVVYDSQQQAFPTQAARNAYAQVANTPAVAALTGLPYAAGSLGGILVIKIWMTLAVALGFASIFLVTRNGRADEEIGRTELLKSSAIGRHAYSTANYAVAGGLSLLTGMLVSLLCLFVTLPAAGSFVMGASIAGTGLAFVGVAAICGQLSSTSRGANSLGVGLLAVFYFIRAGADLQSSGVDPSTPTPSALNGSTLNLGAGNLGAGSPNVLGWFSPIAWAQNMRPYGQDTWWPLLALVLLALGCCVLALRLESIRDLGSGLLPDRHGPSRASGFLLEPVGLVLRLQRSSLVGWFVGAMVAGVFFGGVARAMTDALDPTNPLARSFVGTSDSLLDGVLSIFVLFNGLLAGAFAMQCLSATRGEEASGRLDAQLAGALSRYKWLAAQILVAAIGSALMLLIGGYLTGVSSQGAATGSQLAGASLLYWPAVLLMMGVMLFLTGFAPRWAISISWSVYGASVLAAMFGNLFSLSVATIRATPFGAVPRLPADTFMLLPLVILALLAVALATLGIVQFRRRDLSPDN